MIRRDDEQPGHELVQALLDPSHPVSDPALQVLQLAMTGFGYNFYDARNFARANDLLVREKNAEYLNAAAASVESLERKYRQKFIGAATRENPFPTPERATRAKALHDFAARLRNTASSIITMSVPQSDAIWSRFRDETETLRKLLAFDIAMTARAIEISEQVNRLEVGDCDSDAALEATNGLLDDLERSFAARRQTLAVS
jgi:hypothetical protein